MMCQADGCDRTVERRTGAGLCEMHYYRMRRTGTLVKRPSTRAKPDWTRRSEPKGYVKIKLPADHPALADLTVPATDRVRRWVFEHRLVLWHSLKGSELVCAWCQEPLTWGTLDVDHLDFDKANNSPDNLVASCRPCNIGRGAGANHETWATSIAVRRMLRRHAPEFEADRADVLAMLAGSHNPPVANPGVARAQATLRAARSSIAA